MTWTSSWQNVLGRDSNARPMLPSGDLVTDKERLNLARDFVTVVAVCSRYSGRKANNFGSKDVVRMLFTSIRCGCGELCPTSSLQSVRLLVPNVAAAYSVLRAAQAVRDRKHHQNPYVNHIYSTT